MDKQKVGKKGTLPFRIYYDPSLKDMADIRKDIVKTVSYWSHKNLDFEFYKQNQGNIDWKCYICQSKISIDIKNFDNKSIFCDEHKPKIFTNKFKTDPILLRYISSLFSHIRNTISKNSNTKLYG